MGFSADKRKFFVEAMGEERVAAMEARLFHLEKELEAHGVAFKADLLLTDILDFDTAKAVSLFGAFLGICQNIINAPEIDIREKVRLLKQAAADLATRIASDGGGGKAKAKTTSALAVAKYIDDLTPQRPKETKESKALRETGAPAAVYVSDLQERGVVSS